MAAFVLIHSPLVGPLTWIWVAEALRRKGHTALVPSLFDAPDTNLPYWQQHGRSVAQSLASEPADLNPILVAHSGAGPMLPAVRAALDRPVAGYIFADAGLPVDNKSRFDLFGTPDEVEQFREAAVDGLLTPWTADDLREVIPDTVIRERYAADFRPMPLAVYEEKLPVFAGWPDAPCGYLLFSDPYTTDAKEAQSRGWPFIHLPSGHFHMLVEPEAVADTLLKLANLLT